MKRLVVLVPFMLALTLSGCSKKESGGQKIIGPPAGSSTQLTGVFVNTDVNGLLDVTIDTAPLAAAWRGAAQASSPNTAPASGAARASGATVTAFGTLSPDGGGTVNLTGTYDPDTDSLRLSGQGYALAGIYLPTGAPPRLQGRFSGPLGDGSFVAMAGARTQVHTFCTTYENQDASLWGAMNLAISGSAIAGFEVEDGDTNVVFLAGSVSGTGSTRTLAFVGASFQGNGTWDQTKDLVQGDWSGYVQSGAWDTGVWSGEACLPGTTGGEGARTLRTRSRRAIRGEAPQATGSER